jgi:hypothetical protein
MSEMLRKERFWSACSILIYVVTEVQRSSSPNTGCVKERRRAKREGGNPTLSQRLPLAVQQPLPWNRRQNRFRVRKNEVGIDKKPSQVVARRMPKRRRIPDRGREAGGAMVAIEKHLLLQHPLQTGTVRW